MVGVPKEVMNSLKSWLKNYRPQSKRENLFLQENGLPLTETLLQNRLERLRKQAGIDITYHGLRRGFATMAVQDGGMLPTEVQMALGHADLTTTERNYLMTEQGRAVSAMKRVKLFDKPSRKKPRSTKIPGKSKRKD